MQSVSSILFQDEDNLETEDKETNTECVFVPEKGIRRTKRKEQKEMPSIIIKRSQTFSPVARTQYICRVRYKKNVVRYMTSEIEMFFI